LITSNRAKVLSANRSGAFHIRPLKQKERELDHKSAEEPAPVEAVAVETGV